MVRQQANHMFVVPMEQNTLEREGAALDLISDMIA
jgi:hypothetical protein